MLLMNGCISGFLYFADVPDLYSAKRNNEMYTYLIVNVIAALIYFQLTVYSIKRSRNNKSIRIFSLLCLIFFITSILQFLHSSAGNVSDADHLKKLFLIGWCLSPAVLVHFYSSVTGIPQNRIFKIVMITSMYMIALIIIIQLLFIKDFYTVPVMSQFGWRSFPVTSSNWWVFHTLYMNAALLFAIVSSAIWMFRVDSLSERTQAVYLIAASGASMVVGEVLLMVFQFFPWIISWQSRTDLAEAPSIAMLIFSLIIWLIIDRYKFMHYSGSMKIDEFIMNLHDNVFFTDLKFSILIANKGAKELFSKDSFIGVKITDLLNDRVSLVREVRTRLFSNERTGFMYSSFSGSPDEKLKVRYFPVRDRFSDVIGILWIIKHTSNLKDVADEYSLTLREQDVLLLLVKGFSNTEIAETLDLKTGTVKVHVHNIYSKTDTKSRVELSQILK